MTGWNFAFVARVAVLVGVGLLHITSAVSAETGKAEIMQSLTEADNDRTVDLSVGETVRVTLPENATTGYRWTIDRIDGEVIEQAGSESHYSGQAVGSGGDIAFTFKAKKAGTGEVALKHWRHFEGDASVTRRFRLRFNVKA